MTRAAPIPAGWLRPTHLADPGAGCINPELAPALMRRIWSVGIELAALRVLIGDGPVSDRAAAIVDELDAVIRDIRTGASGLLESAGYDPNVEVPDGAIVADARQNA